MNATIDLAQQLDDALETIQRLKTRLAVYETTGHPPATLVDDTHLQIEATRGVCDECEADWAVDDTGAIIRHLTRRVTNDGIIVTPHSPGCFTGGIVL